MNFKIGDIIINNGTKYDVCKGCIFKIKYDWKDSEGSINFYIKALKYGEWCKAQQNCSWHSSSWVNSCCKKLNGNLYYKLKKRLDKSS